MGGAIYCWPSGNIDYCLDQDICDLCAGRSGGPACIEVCPFDVFEASGDEIIIVANGDDCIGCDLCVDECPVEAITPASS